MRKITKKAARDYVNRWQLVTEALDMELRTTSVHKKFKQMDAAYRMAVGLGFAKKLRAAKENTLDEVRQRWLRLQETRP
ncbi:MAG: hypothetical protein NTNFB02_07000 [Nitrospira sp.]